MNTQNFVIKNPKPSQRVAVVACSGFEPSVIIQDEKGQQININPKLARVLAKQLPEFANIAEMSTLPIEPTPYIL
jgi:hypothetical protein